MWDDFVADVGQVFEALGNFFENHWKLLLTLLTAFVIGVLVGYGTGCCENAADEQAEIYITNAEEAETELERRTKQ